MVANTEHARREAEVALGEIEGCGLEAEKGHVLRLLGQIYARLGMYADACHTLELACECENSPDLGYWRALSLYELAEVHRKSGIVEAFAFQGGDAKQIERLMSQSILIGLPQLNASARETLRFALNNYSTARDLMERTRRVDPIPLGRVLDQQLMRYYGGWTTRVADLLDDSQELLAQAEANGPSEAADLIREWKASGEFSAIAGSKYREGRTVFFRHLNSVADTFSAYVASVIEDHDLRRAYIKGRIALAGLERGARTSEEVAIEVRKLRMPDAVLVILDPSEMHGGAVVLDLENGAVIRHGCNLTEDFVHQTHQQYAEAVRQASAVHKLNSAAGQDLMRAAIANLLGAYQKVLGPLFEELAPQLAGKRVKLYPRLQSSTVPLHALKIGDQYLMEYCKVSYGDTLQALLATRSLLSAAGPRDVVMVFDDIGAPFFESVSRRPEGLAPSWNVLRNPSWEQMESALSVTDSPASEHGDVVFACHGHFDSDDPPASCLLLDNQARELQLPDIVARLPLERYRSVVLGACETSLVKSELRAEYLGLPGVFSAVGARYVVGSLWEVNQLAAAVFVSEYFDRLARGADPVGAVMGASRSVGTLSREGLAEWVSRNLAPYANALLPLISEMDPRPFAHPYFWAGFRVLGDL